MARAKLWLACTLWHAPRRHYSPSGGQCRLLVQRIAWHKWADTTKRYTHFADEGFYKAMAEIEIHRLKNLKSSNREAFESRLKLVTNLAQNNKNNKVG